MHRIKHIVICMLENRSTFNVLGDMHGIAGGVHEKKHYNRDASGQKHYATPVRYDTLCCSKAFPNDAAATLRSVKHNCSGFVREFEKSYKAQDHDDVHLDYHPDYHSVHESKHPEGEVDLGEPMTYFKFGSLPAIHTLAREFAVCERYFSSACGPTWTNRLFALSGTSLGLDDMPGAPGDFRIADLLQQDQATIFTLLQDKGVDYRIYYHDAPLTLLFSQNWDSHVMHQHRHIEEFYADVCGDAKDFPEFVWLEPQYVGAGSDMHPPNNPLNGDHLIGRLYNALRQNEELWQSTLFIVNFDEHGGYYDSIPPPMVPKHAWDKWAQERECFQRYGVRVPCILVSPQLYDFGIIDSTLYDHTSVLASVCRRFDLDAYRLGRRVRYANDFWHLFEHPQVDADACERLPKRLHLVPYDHTKRSGERGFWNSFQKEMARGLKAVLQLRVKVVKQWQALTNMLPDTSNFLDFVNVFETQCKEVEHQESTRNKGERGTRCVIQ